MVNILISTSTESVLAPLKIDFINLSPRLKDTFLGLNITGQISNPSTRFTHLQGKMTLKKIMKSFGKEIFIPILSCLKTPVKSSVSPKTNILKIVMFPPLFGLENINSKSDKILQLPTLTILVLFLFSLICYLFLFY